MNIIFVDIDNALTLPQPEASAIPTSALLLLGVAHRKQIMTHSCIHQDDAFIMIYHDLCDHAGQMGHGHPALKSTDRPEIRVAMRVFFTLPKDVFKSGTSCMAIGTHFCSTHLVTAPGGDQGTGDGCKSMCGEFLFLQKVKAVEITRNTRTKP